MRLMYSGITLDLQHGQIEHGMAASPLTGQQVRLLGWLASRRSRWVPLEELERHVWGLQPEASVDTVRRAVDALVRQLEATPDRPRILRGQPAVGVRLEEPEAVWMPLDAPRWSTPLVGRRDVMEALERATLGHRLVCVVGPAGQGKSRVVGTWAARRGVGVFDATACQTGRHVLEGLADELRLPGGEALPHRIVAALQARGRIGLVLDGLDGLGRELEDVLATLTAAGPELRWVSTSRRRPAVEGAAFQLLEALPVHDALALLQAVAPATVGDPEGSRALVQQARRCPLAIELLAPWLTDGNAGRAVPADDALSGVDFAMGRSWSELSTPLQRSAHALGAFRGGFERSAAVAVLESEAQFDELVRVGLVVGTLDPRRWRRPTAVAAWIDGDMGPPPLEARKRHAAWFTAQVRTWGAALHTGTAPLVRSRMVADRANLEHAWSWAHDAGDGTAAWLGWGLARLAHSAARQATAGLSADQNLEMTAERSAYQRLASATDAHLGGHAERRARFAEAAHRMAPTNSDVEFEAGLELARVRLASAQSDEAALHVVEVSVRGLLDRAPRDARRVAGLALLGDVHQAQGRVLQAQAAWSEVMHDAAELDLVDRWAWAALRAAALFVGTAAQPRAEELLDAVILVAEGASLPWPRIEAHQQRSRLYERRGRRAEARKDLRLAYEGAVDVGDLGKRARLRFEQGALELEEDGAVALPWLEEARTSLSELGEDDQPMGFLVGLALAQARLDRGQGGAARRELDELHTSRWMAMAAFGALWWLVQAVALALDGHGRSALAALDEVGARRTDSSDPRLELGAMALAARLSSEPEPLARLLQVPSEASVDRDALVSAATGAPGGQIAWWLARQIARIPKR